MTDTVLLAERSLLAALATSPELLPEIGAILQPETFKQARHGLIFRAMLQLAARSEPIGWVAIFEELRRMDRLDECGGPAGLAEISEWTGAPRNAAGFARIVAEAHTRRQVKKIGFQISESAAGGGDPAAAVHAIRAHLESLERLSSRDGELMRALLSDQEFMATDWPRPEVLLGDRLLSSGQLGMLHASTGLGKTFLAEQLADSIASGESFLGCFSTPRGGAPVIVFQLELDPEGLKQRRLTRGRGVCRQLYRTTTEQIGRPISILDDSDFRAIVRAVRSVEARLVVFDPLQELHDLPETNETWHLMVRAFRRLSLATGAAVFVVHHEGKESTDPKMKRSDLDADRGGTRLAGAVKLKMRLKQLPNGAHVLSFPKVTYGQKPADVYVARDEHGWWIPIEPPREIGDKTLEAIEKALLLAGSEGCGYDVLMNVSSRSDRAVRNALSRIAVQHGLKDYRDLRSGRNAPGSQTKFVHPHELNQANRGSQPTSPVLSDSWE